MEYNAKVIVICPPRSGSNLLCKSLGRHSQVWNFGEKAKHASANSTLGIREYLDRLYSESTKPVVCIKTLFSQYNKMREKLEPIIQEDGYRVILLRRRSLLKQYISLMVAFANNNFAGGVSRVDKPLTLKIGKGKLCVANWVAETVSRELEMQEHYPEALSLWYESFESCWSAQMERVQEHVGVPYEVLHKILSRQIIQPYRSIVTNYESIKRWLVRNGFEDRI